LNWALGPVLPNRGKFETIGPIMSSRRSCEQSFELAS
jgi:hypothetical protein